MDRIPDRFRAFRITDSNGRISSGFVDCTLDELDPGAVVVRVAYSDINYKDALAATGRGRILRRPQCIGGIDFAGTVVASSDGRFHPGDEVLATGYGMSATRDGGYSEYATASADALVRLPAGLSLWDAMAIGTAGFTAALAVVRMERNGLMPANGPVMITGATGGVGSLAIDIMSRLGYDVTALTRKEGESGYLRSIGARQVMLHETLPTANLRPLAEARWAGAVDNLGGDVLAWLCSTMRVAGTVASVGLAASAELHMTVMPFILRGVSLLGIDSDTCPMPTREAIWRRLGADMAPEHLQAICRTIAFDQLPAAFEAFVEGRVRGRTVVAMQRSEAPASGS